MLIRKIVPTLAGLLALSPAACGGDSPASKPAAGAASGDQVKAVVEHYLTAVAEGDGAGACADLSRAAREIVESRGDCERRVAELSAVLPGLAADLDSVSVTDVEVGEDEARATVALEVDGATRRIAAQLVREQGRWALADSELAIAPTEADSVAPDAELTEQDRKEIEASVLSWWTGEAEMCERVNDRFVAEQMGSSGAEACDSLREYRSGLDTHADELTLEGVDGSGPQASASFKNGSQITLSVELVLVDDVWRIDATDQEVDAD